MANKYVELINTNIQIQARLILIIILCAAIAIIGPMVMKQHKEIVLLEGRTKALLRNTKGSSTSPQISAKLTLEGIMNLKNELVALINGKICSVGSIVETYTVKDIMQRSVSLEDQTTKEIRVINLPAEVNF